MKKLPWWFAVCGLLAGACAQGEDDLGTLEAAAKGAGTSGVDACNEVAADAMGNMGLSTPAVILGSGGLDYASANRSCKRFVVDIGIPAAHQPATPITASVDDPWSSLSANDCPSWVVVASVYERLDKQNLKTGKWTVGQRTKVSDYKLVGVWDADTASCQLVLAEGSVPSFLPPNNAGEQRVIRIAGAAAVSGTAGTLSVSEGLSH